VNKPGKPSFFKASLLAALLASAFDLQAAGLGKLTVYSAIGQPLNAEVALTATPDELLSLTAKLGSHDAFKEAGIEFMPALAGVRFNVVKQPDSQAVLKLTTDRPLNEAFLHFLVELNWTAGRMVREYTFLLDPPEMLQVAKPASVVAPVAPAVAPLPQVAPAPAVPAPARPAAVPGREPAMAAKPQAAPAATKPAMAGGQEVRVKAGDTLSKIARENKPESVSLDQMLVALFNSNREVFDDNNMNRLRAGKILRLPDAAEVAQVDGGEARNLIVSQAADFNAYRRRLAAAAATAPAVEAAPQQQAAGRIKPQVEEKAPAPAAKDKLEVSRTEAAKTGKPGGKGSLEEDLIARDKALREAADRIAELEKNLDNLRQLVELKSQAGTQAQAVAPKPAAAAAKPPEPVKPAAESVVTAQTEESKVPAVAPVAAPAIEKPTEAAPAAVAQGEPAKPAEAAPPPKPAPKKPVPPPPPPPPEPSFLEDNPQIVFGGGGLLALLLGYFGFKAWSKKKREREEAEFAEEPSVSASDLASKSGAIFGAASESVDSGEVSIQGDFSEGGVLTTEESVDPVAEADVYMAYGRDSQAEEILLEGLKSDPTRSAIHLKLLELYANRKSADQFENVARQLHGVTGGQGSDWDKAVAMAAGLGVGGALFAGAVAETVEPAAPQEEVAAVPEVADLASADIAQADEPAAEPALPIAEEAAPAEVAPAPEEAASLDFDLDLGTTSGPAAAAAEAQAAQKSPAEEAMSLDFDFDLGTPEPAAAPAVEEALAEEGAAAVPTTEGNAIDFALDTGSAPEVESEPVVAETAGNEIDFDLDLGSAEAPAESAPVGESVAEAGPEPEPVVESAEEIVMPEADVAAEMPAPAGGMGDLKIDFDLDLGSEPAAAEVSGEDASAGLADIDLDLASVAPEVPAVDEAVAEALALPEVELPEAAAPAPEVPKAEAAGDIDFDLALGGEEAQPETSAVPEAEASIELPDLGMPGEKPAAEAGAAEAGELAALPDIELGTEPAEAGEAAAETVSDDPEVATKLELAQAYEEMGDREGARELLNEVLNEGSPAQQELARARLDQLEV
jgi:pilus assembly protein FimV